MEIPGTTHTERGGVVGVACPWDVIESVAALTQLAAPSRPEDEGLYPGYARYAQLGLPEKTRPHQKEDIRFLCRRSYAVLAELMRAGKTLISIAATVALGAERTIVVGPSISLWNWAKEIYQWTGEEALILSGLSATEARRFCGTCFGRGYLRPSNEPCPACRAKNGQSYGFRLHTVKTMQPKGAGFACPRHPGFEVDWPNVLCPTCRRSLAAEMERSRYIILNYELLTPLEQYDATGGAIGPRGGFGGWLEPLRAWRADVAIFDEAHMLRGWSTAKKQNPVRRERCRELVVGVPRVWALTGTPFWAHTRDIWGILDVISNGLYGGGRGIPGRLFMQRYCAGGPGEFGWTADGLTAFAETELMRRLQHIMIRHSRAEIYETLPPKTREVVDVEVEGVRRAGSLSRERLGAALADEIKHVSAAKRAHVVEKVLSEVAEGAKVVVFCYHVESAEETLKELQKGLKDARFRRMNAKTWFVTGDRPATHKARDSMCEAFREAEGPGVFVATIKAMQVALSLKGAQSVHFIDLDYVPGAMFQAEDRCFDPDGKGFVVYYYQVRGSVDEDIVAAVRERIEMLDAMTNDAEANALRAAFDSVKMREETLDAIWARHTAHLRESLDEPSNLSEDGEP